MRIMIKTAPDGRPVEAEAGEFCGNARLRIYVGGEYMGGCGRNQLCADHLTVYGRATGRVLLTTEQYAVLDSLLSETQAALDDTPEARARNLREQRADLVAAWRGARDDVESAFDRAYESGDSDRAWAGRLEGEEQVKAAAQAVADFDRAHPEIFAGIEAEKTAAAKRHMWD